MSELLPGQCRVLFEEPCPADYMHHDHGYWMLQRAARSLYEAGFADAWRDPDSLMDLHSAFSTLRRAADRTETKPMNVWLEAQRLSEHRAPTEAAQQGTQEKP